MVGACYDIRGHALCVVGRSSTALSVSCGVMVVVDLCVCESQYRVHHHHQVEVASRVGPIWRLPDWNYFVSLVGLGLRIEHYWS